MHSHADVVHVAEMCLTDGGGQRVEEAIHHIKAHLRTPVPSMRVDEDHKRPGIGLSVAIEDGLGDGGQDHVHVSHNHTRPPPTTVNWYQNRPADEHEAVEQNISGPVDKPVVVDRRVLDVLGTESRKHAQAPVNPAAFGPVEEPQDQSVHHVRRNVIAVSQRRNVRCQQPALPLSADGRNKTW